MPVALVDSTNRDLRGTGYSVLPGGRAMLWRQCGYRFGCDGDLAVLDLISGTSKVLVPGASRGWYLSSGHVVYATREGALFAVTFDLASLKVTSTPVAVLDGIQLIVSSVSRQTWSFTPSPFAMITIDIREAKTQLSRLVAQAVKGEAFVNAKAGKPLVKVAGLGAPDVPKRQGFLAGEIAVPTDFDRMGDARITAPFGVSE